MSATGLPVQIVVCMPPECSTTAIEGTVAGRRSGQGGRVTGHVRRGRRWVQQQLHILDPILHFLASPNSSGSPETFASWRWSKEIHKTSGSLCRCTRKTFFLTIAYSVCCMKCLHTVACQGIELDYETSKGKCSIMQPFPNFSAM